LIAILLVLVSFLFKGKGVGENIVYRARAGGDEATSEGKKRSGSLKAKSDRYIFLFVNKARMK